ncbi:EAL domain-containing protein [Robbsia sp. KACC 23696]|uniref:EAL domain-containing protein n=1 Tax=Robbsia sp. KACC 23696 TaxID=3149231 RepID=UPI00325B871C
MRPDNTPSPDRVAERLLASAARWRLTDTHVLLPIFCLILLAVGWLSVYRLLRVEEIAANRAAMQNARELADTYEAQLQRNLVYIDQTLRMLAFNFKQSPQTRLREYEVRGMLPPPPVFVLAVTDAQGIVRDCNGGHSLDGSSVADRAFFRDAAASADQHRPAAEPDTLVGAPAARHRHRLTQARPAKHLYAHEHEHAHGKEKAHARARKREIPREQKHAPTVADRRARAHRPLHAQAASPRPHRHPLRRDGLHAKKVATTAGFINVADHDVPAEPEAVEYDDADGATLMSESIHDPLAPKGLVTFSRALYDAAGRFVGVVLLTVDGRYFTSGYDRNRMGDAGMLLLAGTDAKVRAAQIGDRTAWNDTLIDADATPLVAHPSYAVTRVRWGDGTVRLTSARALHDFPLTAVVGLSFDEEMANYRASRRTYLLSAWVATGVLLLLTALLSRMSWQLVRSRHNARQIQRTYFAASEASLDGFVVLRTLHRWHKGGVSFIVTAASRRATQLLGESQIALVGRRIDDASANLFGPDGFPALISVATTSKTEASEWLHERPDGTRIWLHRQVVRVEDGLVSIIRDISPQKLTDVRRVEQNRLLEMIATGTPLDRILAHLLETLDAQIAHARCAILLCAPDGTALRIGAVGDMPSVYRELADGAPIGPDAGPGGRAIHYRRPVHLSRTTDPEFGVMLARCGLHGFADCWAFPVLAHSDMPGNQALTDVERTGYDVELAHAGMARPLAALLVFVRDPRSASEAELEAIAAATRLTAIAVERFEVEKRIRHMAKHDALTGLPNRILLSERLGEVLARARTQGGQVAVVFIDLDNFKLINDSLGHHAGDILLKTVAHRMMAAIEPADMVVRLGGDEFVLVLCAPEHHADGLASTIAYIRTVIAEPVCLLDEDYRISASIGSARFPEDGDDTQTLLMNADAAMYRAKESGRNTWRAYTSEMNARAREKLRLKEALRHALDGGEFQLVFQPQVDLAASRIFGMEALLRWHHPRHGVIMPSTFISFAEENGLIVPIGAWVLEAACRQNKAWQDAGYDPVIMSVNVSARQFADDSLVDAVADALRRSGLDAAYLELEITESVIMLDVPRAVARMRILEKMGVRLSIDDFGTGYSSLSALKSFPIARLKLDQSFVRGVTENKNDQTIARAVVALCRQLNLEVIAEGVETRAQLTFLIDNGCSAIQGFWFSKPLSATEAGAMLSRPFRLPTYANDAPSHGAKIAPSQ